MKYFVSLVSMLMGIAGLIGCYYGVKMGIDGTILNIALGVFATGFLIGMMVLCSEEEYGFVYIGCKMIGFAAVAATLYTIGMMFWHIWTH